MEEKKRIIKMSQPKYNTFSSNAGAWSRFNRFLLFLEWARGSGLAWYDT